MHVKRSPKLARIAFSLLVVLLFSLSFSFETSARGKRKSVRARGRAARHLAVRGGRLSRRERRMLARTGRRGRVRLSKRELRAERKRLAREQASYIAKLERRAGRKLTRRERAAEMRRFSSKHRRELEEARRRAAAARAAAIARQRALDEGMRNEVQFNIARDTTVGEDMEVRKAAVEALGNHAGTVVVMDPKTGRIYTVVNQEWALRRGFKPCSTIKLVTGVAGLCEKIIQPIQTVGESGRYRIDLTDALAYSNNSFFQHVGGQVGFDKMVNYAREMGLGEKTGINYVNESPGRVPLFKSGFAVNRMSSHGDDFEVTAIQLATMVSAMANGGKLVVPHVPRTVQETSQFRTEVRRKINVENEAWQRMLPGMIGAVNYGSGKKAYRPEQTVAGKTGTCIGQGAWLGLFTSYAPVVNPRLAVVVITRGSDARRHLPAAVAGNIYRALSPRFGTPINWQIAEAPDTPNGKADKKAAALNEEAAETRAATEAEESGDEATDTGADLNANSNRAPAADPKSKVKTTVLPVGSRPKAGPTPKPINPPAVNKGEARPRRSQPDQQQ